MSAGRISLPQFDPPELKKLLAALVSVDCPKWLPKDRAGHYLYLRPTIIGSQPQLGVHAPNEAMQYIIMVYMPSVGKPPGEMWLHTSPEGMVRSWVGGFGNAKVGANYGPSVFATKSVLSQSFHQIFGCTASRASVLRQEAVTSLWFGGARMARKSSSQHLWKTN